MKWSQGLGQLDMDFAFVVWERQRCQVKWEKLNNCFPLVLMRTPADSLKGHETKLQLLNYTVIEGQTLWISYAICVFISICLPLCFRQWLSHSLSVSLGGTVDIMYVVCTVCYYFVGVCQSNPSQNFQLWPTSNWNAKQI